MPANHLSASRAFTEQRPENTASKPVECPSELPEGADIESQNRGKAKDRIEKLIVKIHDLLTLDDLNRQRIYAMTELPDDRTNQPKQDNAPGIPEQKRLCAERSGRMKNDIAKFPLDIQELQTIAAMAKNLKANSKKSNIPIS